MSRIGWYYLHTSGDLIYKRDLGDGPPGSEGSDFVRRTWPVDPERREGAWRIVVEAAAMGAKMERVQALMEKWKLTVVDLPQYLAYEHEHGEVTDERRQGLEKIAPKVWGADFHHILSHIAATPEGEKPDMSIFVEPE